MTSPLISIIVPTLNRPHELRLCLDGFACQTAGRDQFEVIVVDDGSDMDLGPLTAEFENRMTVVLDRREHQGLPSARNAGIDRASGKFLVLYDDDLKPVDDLVDYCLDFHQRNPAEEDSALLYFMPDESLSSSALTQWAYREFYSFPTPGVHDGSVFWGGSTTCKATLFRHCRYDPSFLSVEDAEFSARLSQIMNVRIHFDGRLLGTMTRKVTVSQLYRREFTRGYFHCLLGRRHPHVWSFTYAPYQHPESYLIEDDQLTPLMASIAAMDGRNASGSNRLLDRLCDRLDLHAKAAGWIAAREGRPPVVPEAELLNKGLSVNV